MRDHQHHLVLEENCRKKTLSQNASTQDGGRPPFLFRSLRHIDAASRFSSLLPPSCQQFNINHTEHTKRRSTHGESFSSSAKTTRVVSSPTSFFSPSHAFCVSGEKIAFREKGCNSSLKKSQRNSARQTASFQLATDPEECVASDRRELRACVKITRAAPPRQP